jgi:hypothetical protein
MKKKTILLIASLLLATNALSSTFSVEEDGTGKFIMQCMKTGEDGSGTKTGEDGSGTKTGEDGSGTKTGEDGSGTKSSCQLISIQNNSFRQQNINFQH